MTWHQDEDDVEDEAELDERENPGPEDADWNLDPARVPCPYCKRQITEDTQRCPYCGSYVTADEAARIRPWWWIVAVVLLVLLILRYVLR